MVATARDLTSGRVIAVGGAGGDRDRAKRPMMGRALASADLAVVTSDNPRSEDPGTIIDEMTADLASVAPVTVEPDRRRAIAAAIAAARPGDVVLVLGKGHETGQEAGGVVTPFDDRAVAAEELARLLAGPAPMTCGEIHRTGGVVVDHASDVIRGPLRAGVRAVEGIQGRFAARRRRLGGPGPTGAEERSSMGSEAPR